MLEGRTSVGKMMDDMMMGYDDQLGALEERMPVRGTLGDRALI